MIKSVTILAFLLFHAICFAQKLPPLIPFNDQGKWGYADTTGKLVIPSHYDRAFPFKDGVAIVGYLKNENFEVLSVEFDWTIIDLKGNNLLADTYQYIENLENNNYFIARKGQMYGLLDQNLQPATKFNYDFIHPIQGNVARVQIMGYYGLIDRKGNEVVPCKYRFIYPFREGLACFIAIGNNPDGEAFSLHGYMSETGNIVIQPQFEDAGSFCNGIAYVKKNNAYYRIDKAGNILSSHNYDKIENFVDGIAMVRKNDRFGFINPLGVEILPCLYKKVIPFSEGFGCIMKGGKWHYINKKGQRAFDGDFKEAYPFREDFAKVRNKNQYGFIDTTGRFMSEYRWKDAGSFHNGMAFINITGQIGFINRKNKLVIKPKYANSGDFEDGICPVTLRPGKSRKLLPEVDGKQIRAFFIDKYGRQYVRFEE